jgi:hypothetical protein
MGSKEYWELYKNAVEKALSEAPMNKIFDFLESKTKISRKYLATGSAVLILWMTLGLG